MVSRLIAIGVLAAVLLGLLAYSQQRHERLKVSGFVEAYEIRVGSRIGGRVANVHVQEGDRVRRGAALVELEPFDLQNRLAESRGLLEQRRADLEKLTRGNRPEEILQAHERYLQLTAVLKKLKNGPREQEIKAAEADVEQAEAQVTLARQHHQRAEELRAKQAISQEELDQRVSELRVAQATQDARQEQLELLQAGTRPEDIEEAEARLREAEQAWKLMQAGFRAEDQAQAASAVAAAEASLAAIETQLAELSITAPVDGLIEAVELRPGDLVGANTPAISLMDTTALWIRAYVPENHLNLAVGQKLAITVDSFPGRSFQGHVSFISRQAEFTPGNVQTPEDRSKQVFRVKVLLDEGLEELRPGMSADVWLE